MKRLLPIWTSSYRPLFPLLLCFLTSCAGYHLGDGSKLSRYHTISVPYVEGDVHGELTAALIREIGCCSSLSYCSHGGALLLCVKLLEDKERNIGYRYQKDKKGNLTDRIIPDESRITTIVEVKVVERGTGCVALGPNRLVVTVDFDHDYYFSRDQVNIFSLGQLNDIDTARDSVWHPLNRAIAEKVIAYLNSDWYLHK